METAKLPDGDFAAGFLASAGFASVLIAAQRKAHGLGSQSESQFAQMRSPGSWHSFPWRSSRPDGPFYPLSLFRTCCLKESISRVTCSLRTLGWGPHDSSKSHSCFPAKGSKGSSLNDATHLSVLCEFAFFWVYIFFLKIISRIWQHSLQHYLNSDLISFLKKPFLTK